MRDLATIIDERSIPEPNSGCILWTHAAHPLGYGQFNWDGRVQYAHRLAYELKNGPIPVGLIVRHRCDVAACVNPAHLELGSMADNSADMSRRLRGTHGVKNKHAKLTDALVTSMRRMSGHSNDIAKQFGISRRTVDRVRRRQIWKHVP